MRHIGRPPRHLDGQPARYALRAGLAGLALTSLVLVGGEARAQNPDEIASEGFDPSIYGGFPSSTCGWPTTVLVTGNQGLCTGTLVHPELVITAAHCVGNGSARQIGFGPSGNSRTRQATCYRHPSYNGNATYDFGYCELSQAVDDVPIIPPLFGCEVDEYIVNGQPVTIVGYGETNNGNAGTKYEVETTITGYQNGEVFIGGGGKDSCSGDSGGPVYVQIDDGSWRVFGITSYGGQCGQGGVYGNIATNLAWVEQQTGIDISPCFDSNGTWTPNIDCGGFPIDPGSGNNTSWQQGCGGGPVSGFAASCGTPFTPEGDDEAPSVTITAPANGTVYMSNGMPLVSVAITVDADDGGGFGVGHVSLRIDGQDIANTEDNVAPYEWSLDFPPGVWTLEAVAVDYSQNMAISAPVAIGIDEDPGATDSGDGDGDPTGDGDGDGDPGDGDTGSETSGDTGGDTGGPSTGLTTGFPPGFGGDDGGGDGCNCSTDERGSGALGLFALLGLLGLGLGRRRR